MSREEGAPVKSSWAGGCTLCPKDAEGYAGYETDKRKDLIAHLKDAHQVVVHKAAREVMTTHLNCSDRYVHMKQWVMPDGLEVASIRATVPKEWVEP